MPCLLLAPLIWKLRQPACTLHPSLQTTLFFPQEREGIWWVCQRRDCKEERTDFLSWGRHDVIYKIIYRKYEEDKPGRSIWSEGAIEEKFQVGKVTEGNWRQGQMQHPSPFVLRRSELHGTVPRVNIFPCSIQTQTMSSNSKTIFKSLLHKSAFIFSFSQLYPLRGNILYT